MPWIQNTFDFIWEVLKSEFVTVVAGVIFVQVIQRLWDYLRYGRWRVLLVKDDDEILNRKITTGKAKEILSEDAELAVFLKGIISPYAWVTCDLLEKGREIGLLMEHKKERRFVVNLDKNPQPEPKSLDTITEDFARQVMSLIKTQAQNMAEPRSPGMES